MFVACLVFFILVGVFWSFFSLVISFLFFFLFILSQYFVFLLSSFMLFHLKLVRYWLRQFLMSRQEGSNKNLYIFIRMIIAVVVIIRLSVKWIFQLIRKYKKFKLKKTKTITHIASCNFQNIFLKVWNLVQILLLFFLDWVFGVASW